MRLGSFLMAVALLAAVPAAAQDKASLRLNWYLGGSHGAYVLGHERGYYKEEGIDLTLNEGRGSARSVQLVNSKEDTFAMADAGSLMLAAAKGMQAKAVMSVVNVSSFCVVVRKDSGIASIKDLEGKRLSVTAGDALTQLWPAVVAVNRLNGDSIRLVMMDAAAKVPSLMEKQVDALLGGITDQPNLLRSRGIEVTVFPFYDLGVNTIGMTIIAHPDTIRDKPDLVKRFVRATQKSYEAMIAEPQAAAAAVKKLKDDLKLDSLVNEVADSNRLTLAGMPKGARVGLAEDKDWQQTLDLMKKYRELETTLPATAFYTNEFLSK